MLLPPLLISAIHKNVNNLPKMHARKFCHVIILVQALRTKLNVYHVWGKDAAKKNIHWVVNLVTVTVQFVSLKDSALLQQFNVDVGIFSISSVSRNDSKSNGLLPEFCSSSVYVHSAISGSKSLLKINFINPFRIWIHFTHCFKKCLWKDWNSKSVKKMKNLSIKTHLITISPGNMQWQFMHISCVSSAKNLILEEEKTALKSWIMTKRNKATMKRSWFVHNAATFRLKTAQNMVLILSSLSVNSAAPRLNGSVGVTLTSVSLVIRNNAMVSTYQNTQKINYRNVRVLANVRLEVIMGKMERKKC